jgi:hypothetical protein
MDFTKQMELHVLCLAEPVPSTWSERLLHSEFIDTRKDLQNAMYPSHFLRNWSGMIEVSILEIARADTRAARLVGTDTLFSRSRGAWEHTHVRWRVSGTSQGVRTAAIYSLSESRDRPVRSDCLRARRLRARNFESWQGKIFFPLHVA